MWSQISVIVPTVERVLRTALRCGATEVTCLYRRDLVNMPGSRKEYLSAIEEGAKFSFLTNPVSVLGDAKGLVTGVRASRMELGAPDAMGRQGDLDLASLADAQRQFDAMRPSLNGVPGEVSLSIGSQRFPLALQDGKLVLSGAPESWDSITGNPQPAGPSSTPGPRLVTYPDGMQGYVGPDGKPWRDTSPTTPAWGSTPTPFD